MTLDDLRDVLIKCRTEFLGPSLSAKRSAIHRAQLGCFDFLLSSGLEFPDIEILLVPAQAIEDVDRGIAYTVFQADRAASGGRPPNSQQRSSRIGTLAALTSLWLRAYIGAGTRKELLKLAALQMRGRWFGQISAAELRKALETATEPKLRGTTQLQFQRLEIVLRLLEDQCDGDSRQAFQRAVNTINAETAPLVYGESAIPKTPPVLEKN